MKYFVYSFWLLIVSSIQTSTLFAEVSTHIDPETQRQSWSLVTPDGFELTLRQIIPDQAHGFFLARGFSSTIAHTIATHCPMQTVIKNTGTKKNGMAMTVVLKEWQLKTSVKRNEVAEIKRIKLKEIWQKEWQNQNADISAAAKLAFRWATFPSEQTFQPSGDYNWGITTMGLPSSLYSSATDTFDLNIVWHQDGIQKSEWIHAISCAKNQI